MGCMGTFETFYVLLGGGPATLWPFSWRTSARTSAWGTWSLAQPGYHLPTVLLAMALGGWAGICVSPYNPGSEPTGDEGVFSSSCWSTQPLHSLLGEQWGVCQPQGAWQRDVATLPATCGVISATRMPWRASRECQRSSSEAVQLATSSKQRYSLSSKCAHSTALGAVRLREEGWVDQRMGGKPRPVLGTCCRLTALLLTFQALHAKPGASQNP